MWNVQHSIILCFRILTSMIYHCNSLIYHFLWNKLFITITDDAIFVCVYRTKIALIALSPGRRTRLNPDKTRILKSKWGKMYKRWRTHLNTFEKSDINQRKRETYSGGGTCLSSLSNDPPPGISKRYIFGYGYWSLHQKNPMSEYRPFGRHLIFTRSRTL